MISTVVLIILCDYGGLVLIGKAAVLKTAGLLPLGVRVPRPPHYFGEVTELAEGARLLSVCTLTPYPGFESQPLRKEKAGSILNRLLFYPSPQEEVRWLASF